jgi:hypothetical protein
VAAAFLERLVARADAVPLNYPDSRRGQVGPLIFARQAEIIAGQLEDAVAKGARILTGGRIENHGDRILYTWDVNNVPRMFDEPKMPERCTVVQRLLLSTIPDWETLSKWYCTFLHRPIKNHSI